MSTVTIPDSPARREATTTEATARDALAERLFTGLLESMELLSVHLGTELGLYAVLDTGGPATPPELARRTGIHPRYAREWLEQQASTGILEVSEASDDPDGRRFSLPSGHAEALLDPDSPAAVASLAPAVLGLAGVFERLVTSYRDGGGIAFSDYGPGIRHGIAGMNRPVFANEVASWLSAAPGVVERLGRRSRPEILDVGCGTGWSSIALARAVPGARVRGIDLDAASIEDATRNAAAAGVADRVRFDERDAVTADELGAFDLVCVFEALHDMGDPIGALAALRRCLAEGADAIVADERVGAAFSAPAEFNDRFMYAWSVLHCLPATMAESPKVATGTVMRADTLRRYAIDAGWSSVEELGIDNDFWRFYQLRP